MDLSVVPPPDLDLNLKALRNVGNPFPLYRWLLEHEPVHWSEELGAWVVCRYADVQDVFNRPIEFSADRFRKLDAKYTSSRSAVKVVSDVLSEWVVFRDPPDHTRLRALLQRSFTARQLDRSRDQIQATIDELLDVAEANGEMDFIREFAFPLPAMVIALLLGAPTRDLDSIKVWSDQLAAYLGGAVDEADNFSRARDGVVKLVDYFRILLREMGSARGDDLMSLMLLAEHDGHSLSEEEVISNCVLLLFAGHETTTNLLGNGLFHLFRHPEQQQALKQDPALAESAVEELLRYDGPVPATAKIATCDVALHGHTIRAGDMVIPLLSAANRDPRQFPQPDRLDLARKPNRHLAFGFGIHFCLGAPLARLEARLALSTLLRRYPDLAPRAFEPRWKPMIFLRGLESLPVTGVVRGAV